MPLAIALEADSNPKGRQDYERLEKETRTSPRI